MISEKIEPDNPNTDKGIVTKSPTDWHSINWKKANKVVIKLRRRIFRAACEGNVSLVNKLQRLLLRSYSNTLVSVRQATQKNSGKKTAGVDGKVSLTPKERGELVDSLTTYKAWKPLPTKRIYIPKPNGKKRPLGIPCITDRCIQAMVKNALEPYWEANFEPTSYGFRPGRCPQDAQQRIFKNIQGERNRKWWVFEADIAGCFDNIAHQPLLEEIGNFPAKNLIKQWLKAGYIHKGVFHNTEEGTPQGGIISPLLANIALHGLEEELGIKYTWHKDTRNKKGGYWVNKTGRTYVRFADDFIVLTESEEDAANAKVIVEEWLTRKGLRLSEEKTHITHLTDGFDFLGWNFRKYKTTTKKTQLVTLIKPSKKSIRKIKEKIRSTFKGLKNATQAEVIKEINPIIRGWGNYHEGAVSKEIFSKVDSYIYWKLQRWGRRIHGKKNPTWVSNKYFGKWCPGREDNWVFGQSEGYLEKLAWIKITRHVQIPHDYTPDNPELKDFWEERKTKRQQFTARSRLTKGRCKIANRQDYKCPVCRQGLIGGEEIHLHHIIPKSEGGKDENKNLIYLHQICHAKIHALGATNPETLKMLRTGNKTLSRKKRNQKPKGTKPSNKRDE
ncbi:MAG: group II intron reverse transcriptase/maturase [Moorea sp. SIOASIH]|uniref:group II intron reverse transcriptase/maturase n=1 Tax=Moorena sp. SIOASIH TaxID=2607817 RepID=UPI0013B6D432|nr:group II intron reverse transcriptase/maturase [Moorena sp. SIOASIH]NEO38716.1 group II intron reverse transcriptase/maturase [Moorena sp. SIOASIH]